MDRNLLLWPFSRCGSLGLLACVMDGSGMLVEMRSEVKGQRHDQVACGQKGQMHTCGC